MGTLLLLSELFHKYQLDKVAESILQIFYKIIDFLLICSIDYSERRVEVFNSSVFVSFSLQVYQFLLRVFIYLSASTTLS